MAGFDVVIVGGGTAGCVLAARLSEDPGRSVLLVEAGPDYRAADLPAALQDGRHGPTVDAHDWGLQAWSKGRAVAVPRARVIGGCSATNATFALRGSPADYDSWGHPGWNFEEVLPYFVALEHDLDFAEADYHGADGPVPIRRYTGPEQSAVAAAALEAMITAGLAPIDDHNAPGAVGVGPLPVNAVDGRRVSAAVSHLEPARGRTNLAVRSSCPVAEVEITGQRAVGVRLVSGEVLSAAEVIVSAGTYHSPMLLRASGLTSPAIGTNLIDHPAVSVDLPYYGPTADVALFQLIATLHSSYADPATDPPDLQLLIGGPWLGDKPGFFIGAALLKPRSRGSVGPDIDLNYYADPVDLERMVEGLELIDGIVADPSIRRLTHNERISPRLFGPDLRASIPARTWSYHHPVGTCAIGRVVDEQCRVPDIRGLSVIDASTFPDIPSANTNLPTMMVAERVAARR